MMHLVSAVLSVVAIAACGSKAPPPPAPPPASEPAAAPVEPAQEVPTPVEKSPAEPASPAPAVPAPAAAAEPPAPRPGPSKPAPASGTRDLLAAETAAWEKARPVLQKYCAGCHTRGARGATKKKLDHFDMSSYPVGGHHAAHIGATIRGVLGLSGKRATMPSGRAGSVTGDDLAAIKAWTEAWDAAQAGGAHPAGGEPAAH